MRATAPDSLSAKCLAELAHCAADNVEAAETGLRLPSESVAALRAAGFGRHFVPTRWFGCAGGFEPLVDAAIRIGSACASTAWCATLFAAHSRLAAGLPAAGQEDIWGTAPDALISAAIVPPSGEAISVRGGWALTGRWRMASGVDAADWVLLASARQDGASCAARVFAVPIADCVVEPTWHVVGMRGTGSNTVELNGVVVPTHRTVPLSDLVEGSAAPTAAKCHSVPSALVASMLFAAPIVGAATGALADWVTNCGPAHDPATSAWEAVTQASAGIHGADLLLRDAARRADTCRPDDPTAVAANLRAASAAADMCRTAVDTLFRVAGSRGIDEGSALQRRWRDVNVMAQHGTLRQSAAAITYAQSVLR